MILHDDVKLDYDDVMLVPQSGTLNSRSEAVLTRDVFGVQTVPIIAANMDGVGTFEMATELAKHKCMTALVKHYTVDQLVKFFNDSKNINTVQFTFVSVGLNDLEKLMVFRCRIHLVSINICIDSANGYTPQFEGFVHLVREKFPNDIIMVGNVVTPQGVRKLASAGVNFIKIGIGPGSVCATRTMTGVGFPQVSAVIECVDAASEFDNVGIVADGGCRNPGHVAKALAAGAQMVMLGGMLAGHDEGGMVQTNVAYFGDPVDEVVRYPKKEVTFYGSASKKAQSLHNGGLAEYRASEGLEVHVPYRGKVTTTIQHILGGLRSSLLLSGASTMDEFSDRAEFIKVNHQVNHPYGE